MEHNQQTNSKRPTTTTTSSYFNTLHPKQRQKNDSSMEKKRESSKISIPPFRISLQETNDPPSTELSIIREINKSTRLNVTYGRYAKASEGQTCFLLYGNTATQFEYLLNKGKWPSTINKSLYKLDLPNKIPASYSVVVLTVPHQWDAEVFGNELKQHYPSIIHAVRLYRAGGLPLSKVRIDFSSYKVVSIVIKLKRILLDNDNTAFTIKPYLPPTKVLRCFNCQAYDDHVAAHCPNKNNPVCFRCAQHHLYDSNCTKPIKCTHCNGKHMAGNPSCPVKSEKRQEKNQHLKNKINTIATASPQQQCLEAWSSNTNQILFGIATNSTKIQSTNVNNNNINNKDQASIINVLDRTSDTMLEIKQQQQVLKSKIDSIDFRIKNYQRELDQIKHCVYDLLCLLVNEISKLTQPKTKNASKQALLSLHNKLLQFISTNVFARNTDSPFGEQSNIQDLNASIDNSNQPDNYEP